MRWLAHLELHCTDKAQLGRYSCLQLHCWHIFFGVLCIVFCAVCFNVVLSSLLVAPPLTSDVLLPLLKGVKNWKNLAKRLIYAYDKDDRLLRPRRPPGYSLHNLDDLHGSDEDCLKAVIEIFLQGRGRKQPFWGAVLWSLYDANELQPAASIKSYAELLQGACIIFIDGHCEINRFSIKHNIKSFKYTT